MGFCPKPFIPPAIVYYGSLMWGEKQGIFGEKMLQEGWNQSPIQAIINTGEKNIFIMHGNGGGANKAGYPLQAHSLKGKKEIKI